jgi:hypothetical protein
MSIVNCNINAFTILKSFVVWAIPGTNDTKAQNNKKNIIFKIYFFFIKGMNCVNNAGKQKYMPVDRSRLSIHEL